jgi:hypothetical protein
LIVGKTGKDKCMHIKNTKTAPIIPRMDFGGNSGGSGNKFRGGASLNPLSGSALPLTSEIVWHLIRQ